MPKTQIEALYSLEEYINRYSYSSSAWYVGITSNWSNRIVNDHNVVANYTFEECYNSESARGVESSLIEKGVDGGSGGGDNSAVYVYTYLKTAYTVE
jgi:hypothetical protein